MAVLLPPVVRLEERIFALSSVVTRIASVGCREEPLELLAKTQSRRVRA